MYVTLYKILLYIYSLTFNKPKPVRLPKHCEMT